MNGRLNRLVIRTPEGCEFSLQLAGPVARFLAWLFDLVIVIGILFIVSFVFGMMAMALPGLAVMFMIVAMFVAWFGYGMILEWFWDGRTLGKRVLGLRVIDERGLRLTFAQVAIRNLLRMVDMLPMLYLLGGIACLLSRRCQRLGDLAAGTVVIRSSNVPPPDLASALGDEFNSFRPYPHIEARLRQRVSARLAQVALSALLRRNEFNPADRLALFAEIAAHVRSLADLPPAMIETLSDEHLIRNVVDTLFRPWQRSGVLWTHLR